MAKVPVGIANTWLCPSCRKWVNQGNRNAHQARLRHIKDCDPDLYRKYMQVNAEAEAFANEWGKVDA